MSSYPPPPIVGTTFNPNGPMESSFGSYDRGLPQYPNPYPNASSLHGQGQANGTRPTIPHSNANTHSFRSNAQGARTPSSGNEASGSPYVLCDGQIQHSAFQSHFAHGAPPHEARPISQPPPNPTPSSSGNVHSNLDITAEVLSTNAEGSDTVPPALSELEDGELDDGEIGKTTGRSRTNTTTSSGISQNKHHENESIAHRNSDPYVPSAPSEPLPGLIQDSLAMPNSKGSTPSQIQPYSMPNGFTGNADDPLASRAVEKIAAHRQPSMSTAAQGSKENSLQLVVQKTEAAKQALRDLHSRGFDFNRIVNAGLNPNVLRKLYTISGIPAMASSVLLQQRTVKPWAVDVPLESAPRAATVGNYGQRSKSPQRKSSVDVFSNGTSPHVVSEEVRIKGQPIVAAAKDEEKLVQSQASRAKLTKSSGSTPIAKASGVKAGETKILDRKQYIARMLAAKAGKSATSATTPVPPKTSSITDSGASSQDRSADAAVVITPANVQPLSGVGVDTAPGTRKEDSNVEMKRKAQTDLARQKIEALKLRESNQEQTRPATSSDVKRRSEGPPVKGAFNMADSSISAPRPLTSRQSSYFSLASQKPSFSIPGLFMTSDAPEPVNPAQPVAKESLLVKSQTVDYSTSESSQQGLPPTAAVSAQSPTVDKTLQSSVISFDANPTLPATIPTTTSINRKRQKASDFIDSPSTRIKRPLGHQEDTSVIIDVSDDEISNDTSENESLHKEVSGCPNPASRKSQSNVPGNGKENPVRSLPPLTDFPPRKKSAVMTPPAALASGQSGDLKGLKSKEMEIEVMNRKIAELEQRIAIKAKQATSRTHSPGTSSRVTVSPPPGDASHQFNDTLNKPLIVLDSLDGDFARAENRESFNALAEVSDSASSEQPNAEHQVEKVEQAKAEAEAERSLAAENSRASTPDELLSREEKWEILLPKEHSNIRGGERRFQDKEEKRVQNEETPDSKENQNQQARKEEIEKARQQEADRHLRVQKQPRAQEARQECLQEQEQKKCLDERQARKSEIESGLPLLDAEVERTRKRLESLRQEISGLETELQKGIEGRQGLLNELDDLSQSREALPGPMDLDSCDVGDAPKRATSINNISAVTKLSTSIEVFLDSDPKQVSGAVGNGRLLQERPEKSASTPFTDDRVCDGELEEDVMDISRSDFDEAELSLYSPKPSTMLQDTLGVTDDDENYEPPSKIGISQRQEPTPDAVLLCPDLEILNAGLPAATQNQPSGDQDAKPINTPILGERSPAANADMAGNEQSQRSLSRSPSLIDASDPDDYEPPEPAPLGEVVPRPAQMSSVDSEKSFSPPNVDTNNFVAPVNLTPISTIHQQVQRLEPNRKMGHFIPYESPLKQFKSFRYHPQYLEEVSSGFRSLTYSHTINPEIPLCHYELDGVCNDDSCQSQHLRSIGLSDDKILVDLGAKPDDGSSADEFGNGLREIIHDIRARKIRDFNIVAGEITAYRAKFLGDSSKVLPL